MSARRAGLRIIYNGRNVTAGLAPHLLSWGYTDNAHGKVDSTELRFEDRDGVWRGSWHPQRGDTLELILFAEDWPAEGEQQELPLGLFEIDEPEYSGPPDVIALQGVSLPTGSSLRGEDQYRVWEEVRLSQVAAELAAAGGLGLVYEVPWDPLFDRLEQQDKGDLEFLLGLAEKEALGLKIDAGRLVIYDRIQLEAGAPVIALARGGGEIISYNFREAARERFSGVRLESAVTYDWMSTPEEGYPEERAASRDMIYEFHIPGETGRTLRLNDQRVASIAEAERVAKRSLWLRNIATSTLRLTCLGNPSLLAGMNISLSGFDHYDGLWHIDEVRHSGPGYTCSLSAHRVLAGY